MTAFDLIREGFGVWQQDVSGAAGYTSPFVFTMLFLFGFLTTALLKNTTSARRLSARSISTEGREILDNANTARLLELEAEVADQRAVSQRLTETLSTTFAHLSAGLAIFDADRSLRLFNPALCDLLGLDPVWLARRPQIVDFLSKLRDNRITPEMKDFLNWRRKFTAFQASPSQSNHESEWVLPDGRVFRVTLQPHPLGAIAMLFEDISAQVRVERRHRQETELNQCILDRISDAIFVADASGAVSMANDAFERILGMDITKTVSSFGLSDLGECWILAPESVDFWTNLKTYASHGERSGAWETRLQTLDGGRMLATVSPMPDGSTLVALRDLQSSKTREEVPNDPFRLKDLQAMLGQRKMTLDASGFSRYPNTRGDPVKLRRAIWYLAISASHRCREGGIIKLTALIDGARTEIHCDVPAADRIASQKPILSSGLLRQLVNQADETRNWSVTDGKLPLTLTSVARNPLLLSVQSNTC